MNDEPRLTGNRVQSSPDWVALAGVVVTAALHLVAQARGPNPFFIGGACLFWTAFVVFRARRDAGILHRWGFRADNLLWASATPGALFLAVALGLGIYGNIHGTLWFPAHAFLLFLIYPIWGLAQQLLALGIAVQNLELLPVLGRHRIVVALLAAALFGAIHAPDLGVMAATFLLELVVVPMYFRYRNLWPLGFLHGWLGALFYLWVLGRDMWAENFG